MSKSLPYRVHTLSDNTELWIGKDAKSNDSLTFEYSEIEEWWCHVDEYPGSHIIIKCTNETLTNNIMKYAAIIAVKYSKAKNIKPPHTVSFCKCYQVKKKKRAVPGLVYLTGIVLNIKVT